MYDIRQTFTRVNKSVYPFGGTRAPLVRDFVARASPIRTNIYTFQASAIIDKEVDKFIWHLIIHYLVYQSHIIVREEINSSIVCQYTDDVRGFNVVLKYVQWYTQQTIGLQLWQ